MMLWPWTPGARRRKRCWHHDPRAAGWTEPQSYIRSELIDLGRRKRFWCEPTLGGCGQMWFTP